MAATGAPSKSPEAADLAVRIPMAAINNLTFSALGGMMLDENRFRFRVLLIPFFGVDVIDRDANQFIEFRVVPVVSGVIRAVDHVLVEPVGGIREVRTPLTGLDIE